MSRHPRSPSRRCRPTALCGVVPVLLFAACSGGGGGGAAASTDPVASALNQLGVNTTPTPRETAPGVAAPAGYSPLGTKPALSRTDELLLFNTGLSAPALTQPAIILELTDQNGNAVADVLHAENDSAIPWAHDPTNAIAGGNLRAPVAIDLDGNGLEETAIVHQSGIETRVYVIDDETRGFAARDLLIANASGVADVAACAADLDGDGKDELVVGLSGGGTAAMQAYRFDGQTFTPVGDRHTWQQRIAPSTMYLQFAAGNLDNDRAMEVAVAINEVKTSDNSNDTGDARYAVYDDLGAGMTELVAADFRPRDQTNTQQNGITVSVAIGDVDGDNMGELLLAGITGFQRNCQQPTYLVQALDDRHHGFANIAARTFDYHISCDSPGNPRIRTVHLNALDLDGDGRMEVQANQFVFDDFVDAAPWTQIAAWKLPDTVVYDQNAYGMFDRGTSSIVVGDFTGDDRDDVACFRADNSFVDVYSLAATATTVARVRHVRVPFQNSQTALHSLLLPVNVDTDAVVLSYSEAEYQLVFSEPVVLAALAAPPCADGIGQNVQGCFTAFGNTSTTVDERERSLTISASASAGVNVDGGVLTQSEFELKVKLSAAATRTTGTGYELSKTIVFTSAPTEDTVVFTSVPIDRFVYTVLSHPDPTLIGDKVFVDQPRTPITLQAERSFYNRNVPAGALQIDERVFQHTVGVRSSYPTAAQKNALRAQLGSRSGLQFGPQSVGQGSGGSTELTATIGSSVSTGGALAMGFEVEMQATAGTILAGVSVGVESTRTWKITSGTSTTYTGVVGHIDAAHFAQERYSFGLFTYVQRDPTTGREFQVLNYWVE